MKIEISIEAASELVGNMLMDDYNNLDDSFCGFIDHDVLREAYKVMIAYYTTEAQRKVGMPQ